MASDILQVLQELGDNVSRLQEESQVQGSLKYILSGTGFKKNILSMKVCKKNSFYFATKELNILSKSKSAFFSFRYCIVNSTAYIIKLLS